MSAETAARDPRRTRLVAGALGLLLAGVIGLRVVPLFLGGSGEPAPPSAATPKIGVVTPRSTTTVPAAQPDAPTGNRDRDPFRPT